MRHRHEDEHGDRQRHPGEQSAQPPHYAGKRDEDALYDGLPAVTNHEWGPEDVGDAHQSTPPHATSVSGHCGRGPQGDARPDASIVDDIIGRLTDDEHIDAGEILVMIEGGVVTLTGNVPEHAMKHRAEDIVADANGVRDVHNRIRVDDGSRSAGQPGESIRSGRDQQGSGFSSSARPDPVSNNPAEDSNGPGDGAT